jgi:DNA uptake protein ComE-like DNA-binding protein
VRKSVFLSGLVAALLGLHLPLNAQYQDRDTRGDPKTSANAPAPGLRVDINSASLEDLLRVPGMTRVWAMRIVRYRPYRTKLELEDNGIVTEAVYERIKDYVIAHREKTPNP